MTKDSGSGVRNRSGVQRMVEALESAETFTRAQMAYVVSLALHLAPEAEMAYQAGREAGYWERVAEENAAYPPTPYLVVQGVRVRGDQAAARAAADADRTQRWAGGSAQDALSAFMWDADRPDPGFDRRPPWAREWGA